MTRSDPTAEPPAVDARGSLSRLTIDRGELSARRSFPYGLVITTAIFVIVAALVVSAKWETWTAPSVDIARAARVTATQGAVETTANGVIVARRRAAISSRLSGRLEEILVDVGDTVSEGQLLGRLGHADLDASVAEAVATVAVRQRELAAAEADAAQALASVRAMEAKVPELDSMTREMTTRLADADRILAMQERMSTAGAVSKDGVDSARTERSVMADQLLRTKAQAATLAAEIERERAAARAMAARTETARAILPVADAAVAMAHALRRDADIVAPFAGRVIRKEAEVGEMVSPVNAAGSTTRGAIVTLVDFDSLEMEVDVIERDIAKVLEGADCRIVLDARRDHPYAGVVRQKVPTADRAKSTVLVKVAFTARDEFVLPEMGGRVEFLAAGKGAAALAKDRVLAPLAAITERDGKPGAFVVADGRATFTPVVVATQADQGTATPLGMAEIASGLAGGEDLILSPSPALKSGAMVAPRGAPPVK